MTSLRNTASPIHVLCLVLAAALVLGGCRNDASAGGDSRAAEGNESISGDEGAEEAVVVPPPITPQRLEQFLECEAEIMELSMGRIGRVTQAYMDTDHAERLRKMGESESSRELMAEVLRGSAAEHKREKEEVDRKVQEASEQAEAELQELARECGFASLEEWEAFGKRLQPLRRWRLSQRIQEQSVEARRQMRAQLDQAVARGMLTEEQRDAQLENVPAVDPVAGPPALEPPLTESEQEVIEAFDLQRLIPGSRRGP